MKLIEMNFRCTLCTMLGCVIIQIVFILCGAKCVRTTFGVDQENWPRKKGSLITNDLLCSVRELRLVGGKLMDGIGQTARWQYKRTIAVVVGTELAVCVCVCALRSIMLWQKHFHCIRSDSRRLRFDQIYFSRHTFPVIVCSFFVGRPPPLHRITVGVYRSGGKSAITQIYFSLFFCPLFRSHICVSFLLF